ncbi:hypothetical protein JNUCC0626_48020 [Lentzea sp. JNUCC 0626]|uniref:hypothetical protein n=1 Tax=Lentzea sp. JNUCC 0626 TaxID=3367513 RepID=UPI003748231E
MVQQLSTADPQAFYLQAHWFGQAILELEDVKNKLTKYQRMLEESWRAGEKQQYNKVSGVIRHLELLISAVGGSGYPELFRQAGDAVSDSKRRLHELQAVAGGGKGEESRGDVDQRATKVLEDLSAAYREFGGKLTPLPDHTVLARSVVHESSHQVQDGSMTRTGHEHGPAIAAPAGAGAAVAVGAVMSARAPVSTSARSSSGQHERADVAPAQVHMASSSVPNGQLRSREPSPFARFSQLASDRVAGESFSDETVMAVPVASSLSAGTAASSSSSGVAAFSTSSRTATFSPPAAIAGFSSSAKEQPRASVLGRSPAPGVNGASKELSRQAVDREIAALNTARPAQLTTTSGPAIATEVTTPAKTVPGDVRLSDPGAVRAASLPQAPPSVQLLGSASSPASVRVDSFEQIRSQLPVGATASLASAAGLQVRPVTAVGVEPLLMSGAQPAGLPATAGAGANSMGVPPTSLMHQSGAAMGALGATGRAGSVWVKAEPGSWNGAQPVVGQLGRQRGTGGVTAQDESRNSGARKE